MLMIVRLCPQFRANLTVYLPPKTAIRITLCRRSGIDLMKIHNEAVYERCHRAGEYIRGVADTSTDLTGKGELVVLFTVVSRAVLR